VNDEEDFTEVTFPQDLKNCAKCHAGPDGDHWYTRPSIEACGSCHDDVNFTTGENHAGGMQANNAMCTTCHPANGGLSPIIEAHLTETSTPHNPDVPEGLVNFEYVIEEVTVSGDNQPVVKFRILSDGEPVTFKTFAQDATVLIDNFTGSPSFLVAYALPQDGIDTPADYNQLGKARQPASVSILNVWNGTQGSLSGPDEDGNYVATLNGPTSGSAMNAARLVGAQLRAAALQGYFTQVSPASNRHTVSVVKGVAGVQCGAKCRSSEMHQPPRVASAAAVIESTRCSLRHLPQSQLDEQRPGIRPGWSAEQPERVGVGEGHSGDHRRSARSARVSEASMRFRSLHAIQASMRNFPDSFATAACGVFYFDFSEVTFPGILSNCETCHRPGTYDTELPENLLVTTDITTDGLGTTREGLQAARNNVPNDTDLVHSPTAGTCYWCHDSNPAAFHFGHNGGVIDTERSEALRQE
jgi:OmcA/MtrC family decaheme c-type cytochrome